MSPSIAVLFVAAFLPAMTIGTFARAQVYQSVSSSSYSAASQTLTFTYTYNTGSYVVSALSITGEMYDLTGATIATFSPSCSGLPAGTGSTITCTASYTTTATDVSMSRTFQAYVTSYEATSGTTGNVFETGTQGSPAVLTISYTPPMTSTSTTLSAAPAGSSTYGDNVTLTATVSGGSPTGTVTFYDGGASLGSGSLNGSGQASISTSALNAGSHVLSADYGGDGSHSTSTDNLSYTVNKASQTISFPALANTQLNGVAPTLSATATSGLTVSYISNSTGVCTVSGSTITLVATGTCSITASQAGNTNYLAAASVTNTFSVTQATQTITFPALADTSFSSAPPALTATASSGLTVSYASNSTGVCTVSGSTISFVATGSCSITASQAGDASYLAAAPVTQTFNVTAGANTITFGGLADRALNSGDFAVAATASSGLSVSFASPTAATCSVSGSTVTLLSVGLCTIEATQAGDATYAAATPVSQSFNVTAAVTTVTLTANSTTIMLGTRATLTATVTGANPTGNITFLDGARTLRTVALAGGTASISTSSLGAGSHDITAQYGGDANNLAATSTILTLTVSNRPDPTQDPNVVGTVNAQAAAMQRFAQGQIDNITGRLQQLHGTPPNGVWFGGLHSFGSLLQTATPNNTFATSGLTVGFDHAFLEGWHTGVAMGYGWDSTSIGSNGSITEGSSVSASAYTTFRPMPDVFVDLIAGYGYSEFTSRRYSTPGNVFLDGNRTGHEFFGSATISTEQTVGNWTFAPYGSINAVRAVLDPYTETGSSVWALSYDRASVTTVDAVAGLRASVELPVDWGSLNLNGHFEGATSYGGTFEQAMGYADLGSATSYTMTGGTTRSGRGSGGLGLEAQMGGLEVNIGYDFSLIGRQIQSQTIRGGIQYSF